MSDEPEKRVTLGKEKSAEAQNRIGTGNRTFAGLFVLSVRCFQFCDFSNQLWLKMPFLSLLTENSNRLPENSNRLSENSNRLSDFFVAPIVKMSGGCMIFNTSCRKIYLPLRFSLVPDSTMLQLNVDMLNYKRFITNNYIKKRMGFFE